MEGKAIFVTPDCPEGDDKDFTPSGIYIVPLQLLRPETLVPFKDLVNWFPPAEIP